MLMPHEEGRLSGAEGAGSGGGHSCVAGPANDSVEQSPPVHAASQEHVPFTQSPFNQQSNDVQHAAPATLPVHSTRDKRVKMSSDDDNPTSQYI
jgi:hypothetical protein